MISDLLAAAQTKDHLYVEFTYTVCVFRCYYQRFLAR